MKKKFLLLAFLMMVFTGMNAKVAYASSGTSGEAILEDRFDGVTEVVGASEDIFDSFDSIVEDNRQMNTPEVVTTTEIVQTGEAVTLEAVVPNEMEAAMLESRVKTPEVAEAVRSVVEPTEEVKSNDAAEKEGVNRSIINVSAKLVAETKVPIQVAEEMGSEMPAQQFELAQKKNTLQAGSSITLWAGSVMAATSGFWLLKNKK